MAKINYGFEKRQRELAKQKKQEAKDARKREARAAKESDTPSAPDIHEAESTPAPTGNGAADAGPRVHRRTSTGD